MKGDPQVIEHLNKILGNELIAINQYFLHARMYRNWGLQALNDWEYKESIEEMQHADILIERILFLDGLPNLQDLGKLHIGENVQEMLECDLRIEHDGRDDLIKAIRHCESVADYPTSEMLKKILAEEEEHIDIIETELLLLQQVGLENYLQRQMRPANERDEGETAN